MRGIQVRTKQDLVPAEVIENKIFLIRGRRVMIDFQLAELYRVETKALNRAVRRNLNRFPEDFMFQLDGKENEKLREFLRYQIGTSKEERRGGRRYLPYVFTEQGVAMLSSVLNSDRAIQVNIAIMRAFVKLREILSTHKELAVKLKELEMRLEKHDEEIQAIFQAIAELMAPPPEKPKHPIGFTRG
jgi:phage regulator Rha-like protein